MKDRVYFDTVERWAEEWLKSLRATWAIAQAAKGDLTVDAFCVDLSPWFKDFVNFTVEESLARPCWPTLSPLIEIWAAVLYEFPPLLDVWGRALVAMHRQDKILEAECKVEGSIIVEGISFKDMPAIVTSSLYESRLAWREDQRLAAVQNSTTSKEDKLNVIEEMLET